MAREAPRRWPPAVRRSRDLGQRVDAGSRTTGDAHRPSTCEGAPRRAAPRGRNRPVSAAALFERSAPCERVRPEDQTSTEWWSDYCREPDPQRYARGLRLGPTPARYRDSVRTAAECLAAELRRERDEIAGRLELLLADYGKLLCWLSSLIARHLGDDAIERLLADALDDAPLSSLPREVAEDLAPLVAEACRLAERAGLRKGVA